MAEINPDPLKKTRSYIWAWMLVAVFSFTFALIVGQLNEARETMRELKVHVNGGGLRFSSMSDGPFLITHLYASGYSEREKKWAELKPAVLVVDSGGAFLSPEGIKKLKWVDYRGEPCGAPGLSEIQALFVRPERSVSQNQEMDR